MPRVTAVPLLVYDPEGASWPEHRLVSTIDVAPTFLRAIGGIPDTGWRGAPLQAPLPGAVPLGTGDYTGTVAELDGRLYRYLCNRDERRELVKLLDGRSLEGTTVRGKDLDAVLPRLRTLQRQATSADCHRQG